jgi:predicted enzyme related to lactoylglutathione lyase
MLKQVAYTSYLVEDMDRAVQFYQNVLGFKLLFHREDWSEFDIGGQRLALQKVAVEAEEKSHGGAVVSFFTESIEREIRNLKDRGVEFAGELEVYSYGKIAWFRDTEGNTLGLYEPPKV